MREISKNDSGGVWRTVGGRRVFIRDGQDLTSAMKESGKFPNAKNDLNSDATSGKMKPTNTAAVEEELYILKQFGEQTGNEHATIMSDDGKVLGNVEGQRSQVAITAKMQQQIDNAPENSIIFAHNHPNNSGFSDTDLAALAHPAIKEMRVVGHDGNTYTMIVGNGKRPSSADIMREGQRFDGVVEKKLGQMIRDGKLTPQQAGHLHNIEKGYLFAEAFGWTYERGKIDE